MLTENQLTAAGLFLLAIVTTLVGALPMGIVFMLIALYYFGKAIAVKIAKYDAT